MKLLKALVIALCSIMLINIMGATVSAASLSTSTIIVEEGGTASIKLNGSSGQRTWVIGNTKVFSYSNGTVTGKKEGSATLTCKNNGKSYKCNVIVVKKENIINSKTASVNVNTGSSSYVVVDISDMDKPSYSLSGSKYLKATKSEYDGKALLTLTGQKAGTAKVTIKSGNEKKVITVNVGKSTAGVSVNNNSNNNTSNSSNNSTASNPAEEVLAYVNKARAENGLDPLELDTELCENAQLRANEVAGYFSHTRPNGSSCFTAITLDYSAAAENIAMGYTSAEKVVNGWLNSSGHRKNILGKSYTKLGVGYDPATNSWVQLFVG